MKTRFAIYCAILMLTALAAPRAMATLYISGCVQAKQTGVAVKSANVLLLPATPAPAGATQAPLAMTQTLANGAYVLQAPAPGAYALSVSADNYQSVQITITAPRAGLTQNIKLLMLPTLQLRLAPPAGKRLEVGSVECRAWYTTTTGSGGFFMLTGTVSTAGGVELPLTRTVPEATLNEIGATTDRMLIDVLAPGNGWASVRRHGWPRTTIPVRLHPEVLVTGHTVAPPVGGAAIAAAIPCNAAGFALGITLDAAPRSSGAFRQSVIPGFLYHVGAVVTDPEGTMLGLDWQTVMVGLHGASVTLKPSAAGRDEFMTDGLALFRNAGTIDAIRRADPARAALLPHIAGTVLDATSGKPVVGCVACLQDVHGQLLDGQRTDATGSFDLQRLPGQPCKLQLSDSRHVASMDIPAFWPADAAPVVLKAKAAPSLTLDITGPEHESLAGMDASVETSRPDPIDVPFRQIGQGGELTIWPLSPLDSDPEAFVSKLAKATSAGLSLFVRVQGVGCRVIHLPTWPAAPIPCPLERGTTLIVHVQDPQGKSMAKAVLKLTPGTAGQTGKGQGNDFGTASAVTDAAGRATIPSLPAGPCQASITGAEQSWTAEITLAGAIQDVTLKPPQK